MLTHESAAALLTQFSQALGVEGMAFDEEGVVNLRAGDDVLVSLAHRPEDGVLILCSRVHDDASTLTPSLLRRLLATNVKLLGEAGPAFAVVPGVGAVVLEQCLAMEGLDYGKFEGEWTTFVDRVELARERLAEAGAEVSEGAKEEPFSLSDHLTFFRP